MASSDTCLFFAEITLCVGLLVVAVGLFIITLLLYKPPEIFFPTIVKPVYLAVGLPVENECIKFDLGPFGCDVLTRGSVDCAV